MFHIKIVSFTESSLEQCTLLVCEVIATLTIIVISMSIVITVTIFVTTLLVTVATRKLFRNRKSSWIGRVNAACSESSHNICWDKCFQPSLREEQIKLNLLMTLWGFSGSTGGIHLSTELLRGLKTPQSKGFASCVVCSGKHSIMMSWSLAKRTTSG